MPEKQTKRPHEMTTQEAMEHLYTKEGARQLRRVIREIDEANGESPSENESDDDSTQR